jgi:hypothetical protein
MKSSSALMQTTSVVAALSRTAQQLDSDLQAECNASAALGKQLANARRHSDDCEEVISGLQQRVMELQAS